MNLSFHLMWYEKQFPGRLKVQCKQKSHNNLDKMLSHLEQNNNFPNIKYIPNIRDKKKKYINFMI